MRLKLFAMITSLCIIFSLITGCEAEKLISVSDNTSSEPLVQPIEGLASDFIKGMDISSIISQEKSGVVYYNSFGQPQNIFVTLAEAGINYIRVRVWNDPYDSQGNGYGGGNCDTTNAATIGKRAADCGMKLLVDFHYSDFWADPDRQTAPKAWVNMSFEDKKNAIYNYTVDTLNLILEAGADVGIVQIGNEINGGIAGETQPQNVIELLKQASQAVKDVCAINKCDIKVAVHYTDIHKHEQIMYHVNTLKSAGVDYNIFGISYYPYWHGSMSEMADILCRISQTSGKDTMILETAYPYTTNDGDGFANSMSQPEPIYGYPATVHGQAKFLRDIMATASAAGSRGVFWWEGAWIPVGDNASSNSTLWEKYGSGWASSYSAEYDPNNAGKYYGGSSWDNQAMFDFNGYPLDSLDVFKLIESRS